MKKLKIAGYQGDGSVHTRSVKFFIHKVFDYFDISFDQDITEKGQKAASLIEANFNKANLFEADFTGANILNANFEGANLNNATWIDGKKCGLNSIGECSSK